MKIDEIEDTVNYVYNKNMWFVYILLCQDKSFYCGSTNNLQKRFAEHLKGKGGRYTRSHKPIKIVHAEEFNSKNDALKREAEIKSWTRTKKIKILGL